MLWHTSRPRRIVGTKWCAVRVMRHTGCVAKYAGMTERTRGYAHRIDVAASVSAVWAAFTTSASLASWCSLRAAIDARPGGSVRLSVDSVTEFEAVIDVFAPERRMRLIYLPSSELPPTECTLVDDFVLEARPRVTIVRLLGSGLPSASAWDVIYLRRRRGWEQALARLKIYLERDTEPQAGR